MKHDAIHGSQEPLGGLESTAARPAGKYMDWKVDWAFKKVFSDKEVASKLLRDILREDIVDIEFLSNEIPALSEKDKRARLDVICQTSDGRSFVCEMQKKAESDLRDRLLFYGSHLIVNQVKRGDPLYTLSPVYVLCITDFEMEHDGEIPPGKILFGYHLRENDLGQDIFADRLSFHILELPRLARQKKFEEMTDSAEKWAYMFQDIATFAGQPESVPEFSRAVELSRVDSLTQEEKNQYHNAMVSEYEKLGISTAYEQIGHKKGLEEGLEKGIEQGKMEVARKMKEMDLTTEQISQATGLSPQAIAAL